jgi:uncharacterized protein YuzE
MMRIINVKITDSVNGIKFGTSRDIVRKEMDAPFTEFKKSKYSINTTDDFGFCHVFYDKEGNVEAFEFFNEDIEIKIGENVVFPGGIKQISSVVDDFENDGEDYISKKHSIGLCVVDGRIESILFGNEGYYID